MKSTDLRRSNLVYVQWRRYDPEKEEQSMTFEGVVTEVKTIDEFGINYDAMAMEYDGRFDANPSPRNMEMQLVGVPLTEEWLLRLGFEKDRRQLGGLKFSVFVKNSGDPDKHFEVAENFDGLFGMLGYSKAFPAHCLYVHQLQNLYHALTGEELEVKEAA